MFDNTVSPDEPRIDRSYDQTAKHDHNAADCPACRPLNIHEALMGTTPAEIDLGERVDEGNAPAESNQQFAARVVRERRADSGNNADTGSSKHVSPSILEFRIQTLTKENRDLRIRLKLAVRTVSAFEQLTQRLSDHIEKLNAIITDTCEAGEHPYRFPGDELQRTENARKRA